MIKKKYGHRTIHDEQIQKLYLAAKAVAVPTVISEQMCSGGVGAAVCTKQGHIFTGVCVDTDCSLGMCAERNALCTMITANGEIAGIALATIKDRTVRSIYIDAIFVLEPFRRRGIATRLFRQMQDTASEIGAERMDLMVWAFNAPALAFYKSLGMKEQRIVLEKQVK